MGGWFGNGIALALRAGMVGGYQQNALLVVIEAESLVAGEPFQRSCVRS